MTCSRISIKSSGGIDPSGRRALRALRYAVSFFGGQGGDDSWRSWICSLSHANLEQNCEDVRESKSKHPEIKNVL